MLGRLGVGLRGGRPVLGGRLRKMLGRRGMLRRGAGMLSSGCLARLRIASVLGGRLCVLVRGVDLRGRRLHVCLGQLRLSLCRGGVLCRSFRLAPGLGGMDGRLLGRAFSPGGGLHGQLLPLLGLLLRCLQGLQLLRGLPHGGFRLIFHLLQVACCGLG